MSRFPHKLTLPGSCRTPLRPETLPDRERAAQYESMRGPLKIIIKMKAAAAVVISGSTLFVRDEAGQDLIEYALVASLLALAAVTSLKSVGSKLASSFLSISSSVTSSI